MSKDISAENNLRRLLGALRITRDDLTADQFRCMEWLSESGWRTIDNLEELSLIHI